MPSARTRRRPAARDAPSATEPVPAADATQPIRAPGPGEPTTHRPVPTADAWRVIEAHFDKHGLAQHQTASYDHFILHLLPQVVEESQELRVVDEARHEEHVISVCNVTVQKPAVVEADGHAHDLMPHLARLRGLTYSSSVVVDVLHDIRRDGAHVERRIFREVLLCTIPCMVGSTCCHTMSQPSENECRMDQGGYFIINGVEKVGAERRRRVHPSSTRPPRGWTD